jgi:opine dehydrogenase
MVYKRKLEMKMGTSPKARNEELINIMNDIFDTYVKFLPADNLLEVDFENINFTLHPFPVILNYGEIEKNGKAFRHYMDGITPMISEKMKKLDEERLEVGKTLGLNLQDVISQLKMYYGKNDANTIYEYVQSDESPYKDLVGQSVNGRYITEDVPGVIVPIMLLAERVGMKMPAAELAVKLSSFLHDVDYIKEGTTLEVLGIEDMDIDQIIKLVS